MHGRVRAVGIGAAIVGGAGFATQSKINGLLGNRLHDGLAAALISFLSGAVIVGAVILASPTNRRSVGRVVASLREGSLAWWECLGGLSGAALVASQGLSVAALGVAVFIVAVVAGQTFAGLAVDRAGLGPGGPQPLTSSRVFGAVTAVGAVILAVANEFGSPRTLAYALLPLIAGATTSWQQAVNGQVRVASGRVEAATLVNFIAGTVALVAAYSIDVAFRGTPTGDLPTAPWYYLGGALGVVSIAIAAGVVRHTGVLLLTLGLVAGQLIAALVIDTIAPGAGGRPSAL
ncbi:MAG TPA: DMT family transporter, partial [Micromonosporaceae bacterium]